MKKILTIMLTVMMLASFFAVSVSAAQDYEDVTNNKVVTSKENYGTSTVKIENGKDTYNVMMVSYDGGRVLGVVEAVVC